MEYMWAKQSTNLKRLQSVLAALEHLAHGRLLLPFGEVVHRLINLDSRRQRRSLHRADKMATEPDPGLEEVGMALDLLRPFCQGILAFTCLKGLNRIRVKGFVCQNQKKLVFLQCVHLSNLAGIENSPWLRRFVLRPSFRDVDAVVCTIY